MAKGVVHQTLDGEIHVHAPGCKDVTKRRYKNSDSYPVEGNSISEIVQQVYPPDEFTYDPDNPREFAPYFNDVKVLPCVKFGEGQ